MSGIIIGRGVNFCAEQVEERIRDLSWGSLDMIQGIDVRIELVHGFEMYGAHEGWGSGFRISVLRDGKVVAVGDRERLADALANAETELKKWEDRDQARNYLI